MKRQGWVCRCEMHLDWVSLHASSLSRLTGNKVLKIPRYRDCWSILIFYGYLNSPATDKHAVLTGFLQRAKGREFCYLVIISQTSCYYWARKSPQRLVRMKSFLLLALLSCCVLPLVVGTRFVCYFPNWSFYRQGIFKLLILYCIKFIPWYECFFKCKGEGNFSVGHIDPYLCTDLVYSFTVLNATTYKMEIYDSWFDIDKNGYAGRLRRWADLNRLGIKSTF